MADGDSIDRLRDAAADAHHRLRQQKAVGDAQALTQVLELARAADATPEDISQITGGFSKIASELIGEQGKVRRRPWGPFSWLRRPSAPESQPHEQALSAAQAPRQLPPGA